MKTKTPINDNKNKRHSLKLSEINFINLKKRKDRDREIIISDDHFNSHADKNYLFQKQNKCLSNINRNDISIQLNSLIGKLEEKKKTKVIFSSSDESVIEIFEKSVSFEEDESITERIDNFKSEKIFEESFFNHNSANNPKHESSVDENHSKEEDLYDINFKSSNKNKIKSDQSVGSWGKTIPPINKNNFEKQETTIKPSQKILQSTIKNNKRTNEGCRSSILSVKNKNDGNLNNSKISSSQKVKLNNELNQLEQSEEEKRDLNKLKHEIKNNLFLNYTKPEEDEKFKKKIQREEWRKISKKKKSL